MTRWLIGLEITLSISVETNTTLSCSFVILFMFKSFLFIWTNTFRKMGILRYRKMQEFESLSNHYLYFFLPWPKTWLKHCHWYGLSSFNQSNRKSHERRVHSGGHQEHCEIIFMIPLFTLSEKSLTHSLGKNSD